MCIWVSEPHFSTKSRNFIFHDFIIKINLKIHRILQCEAYILKGTTKNLTFFCGELISSTRKAILMPFGDIKRDIIPYTKKNKKSWFSFFLHIFSWFLYLGHPIFWWFWALYGHNVHNITLYHFKNVLEKCQKIVLEWFNIFFRIRN